MTQILLFSGYSLPLNFKIQQHALKYFSVLLELKTFHLAKPNLMHEKLCRTDLPHSLENAASLLGNS